MPEPDEDTHLYVPSSRSKDVTVVAAASSIMDLDVDLDLDNPWPLDQSGFVSNPMSPFVISTSEQPCSPLWAFSDADNDDRIAAHANYPLFLKFAGNPSAETENPKDNDENRKLTSLPSPFSGLVHLENSDGYCMIKERMTQALRYFKESTEQHVLAQVWVPVKVGGRYVLTTSGQPFVLDPHSNGLHQYRMVSLKYMFSVDGDNGGELGLPGRVFWKKLPEWTPNVQYYSSTEYSRLDHALDHNVRGTMALPVFEPSGQSCVGVIELVLTSQKINYAPEVDKVCKALQVGLTLFLHNMFSLTSVHI
ncbi:hypothetical protein Patl1_17475 [Pistacia atlantica]|uniref:Uncharacterized protein n=1 Tax=Pistacia atlantica TaxID=434234 RepID=A0ACC1BYH1_9ROSI|nr:hypothetical protein Patl1_17475 [Pistacia atlantica]